MKRFLFLVVTLAFASSVFATTTCKKDMMGNLVCTNSADGYQTTTKRDMMGNDVTTDNRGNRQTCKKDMMGSYVCN